MKIVAAIVLSLAVTACAEPRRYPATPAGERMQAFDTCLDRVSSYRGAPEIKACQDWAERITSVSETKREAAKAASPSTS